MKIQLWRRLVTLKGGSITSRNVNMQKYKRTKFMLITFVILITLVNTVSAEEVEIHFMDIDIASYVPTSIKDIEEHTPWYGKVDVTNDYFRMIMLIIDDASPTKILGYDVRVKMIFEDGRLIYINHNGDVLIINADGTEIHKKVSSKEKLNIINLNFRELTEWKGLIPYKK